MIKERINRMLKVCLAGIFSILLLMPVTTHAAENSCIGNVLVQVKMAEGSAVPSSKDKISTVFELNPVSEKDPKPKDSFVKISGVGKAMLGNIEFSQPGDYYYELKPKLEADKNTKLNQTESYYVRFSTYYDTENKLQVSVTAYKSLENAQAGKDIGKDPLIFRLNYTRPGTSDKKNPVNTSTYINNVQWLYLAVGSLLGAMLISLRIKAR